MDKDIPSWSKYFMNMAETASTRSKDPFTKVGAYIVDKNNRTISSGFNGMVEGMLEDDFLWQRPTKYDFVLHAELNAILNCSKSPKGGKIFITLFPCKNCAKAIAGAGIKKVYYKDHELNSKSYLDPISVDIFKRCGIEVLQVK